jgi:hypothetical protein
MQTSYILIPLLARLRPERRRREQHERSEALGQEAGGAGRVRRGAALRQGGRDGGVQRQRAQLRQQLLDGGLSACVYS